MNVLQIENKLCSQREARMFSEHLFLTNEFLHCPKYQSLFQQLV